MTNGHLDVIERAAKLFDRVIVAVAQEREQAPAVHAGGAAGSWSRARSGTCRTWRPIRSTACWWTTSNGAPHRRSCAGLRAVSDFEFEFQLALMNRKLNERIETIFMMPKDTYTFLSSRIVKEIAQLGGDVSAFVPAHVRAALAGKFKQLGRLRRRCYATDRQSAPPGGRTTSNLTGELPVGGTGSGPARRDRFARTKPLALRSGGADGWTDGLLVQGRLRLVLRLPVRPLPETVRIPAGTRPTGPAICRWKARKRRAVVERLRGLDALCAGRYSARVSATSVV